MLYWKKDILSLQTRVIEASLIQKNIYMKRLGQVQDIHGLLLDMYDQELECQVLQFLRKPCEFSFDFDLRW